MNITVVEAGWLVKDDSLSWTINGVEVDPATRTRREEYHFAADRCLGNLVLDAASGYVPGWHQLPYILTRKEPNRFVVALDENAAGLQMPESPAVLRIQGNLLALPFANASFDTVLCVSTLEHLSADHINRALKELLRVCRRRLILTADEANWLPRLFGGDDDHGPKASPSLVPAVYCMTIELDRSSDDVMPVDK